MINKSEKIKKIHLFTCIIVVLLIMPVCTLAQSLKVVKNFDKVPFASVLAMYNDYFQKWENPNVDNNFSYAVIRVRIEGNQHEVLAAKKHLSLYLGQHYAVETTIMDIENELLFLIPSSAGYVTITCGEGCKRQQILSLNQLEADAVYDGVVHYVPAEEVSVVQVITQAPKRQFFKFRVTPSNAVVTIVENGAQEILPMREGGIASKMLNYGTYNYSIAADKYYTKEGSFTVSATQTEMTVDLLPQFGWLTIAGDNISQGSYVFATNTATGGMIQLGTIPLNNKEMDSGIYTLRIQKEKYKEYSTTITIENGKTITIRPSLEANYAQVTLITNEGADIYMDGSHLGTTRWTGTLELGEHSIEARQLSHHSAYTSVRITPQSTGQTIKLNNPLPIYGSLIVDGSPADVAVYVDGKKVGTSPLFVSELLIGRHTVCMEKKGYEKQERKFTITEGKEELIEYTLTKVVAKEPIVTSTPQSSFDVYANSWWTRTFILGQFGYSATPQQSYGLMLGQVYGGMGWYINARSNFKFNQPTALSCDKNGSIDGITPFYSGITSITHLVINAGFMWDIADWDGWNNTRFSGLGFYVGVGYGKRELQWETEDGAWVKYAPTSHTGFSGNLGIFGSLLGITINLGVNTINFKYAELEAGVGVVF